MTFETYPFEKLSQLLEGVKPNKKLAEIALTIGEPQFKTPSFIQKELCNTTSQLNKYPKSAGEESLKEAIQSFCKTRFDVKLKKKQLIPTFGTREVLFNFPQFYLSIFEAPTMAFTNPFYQIYEGAAIASRAKVHYINLTKKNGFKPVIDEKTLSSCQLVILNFPNNPTASVLSMDELCQWVELSKKLGFVLLNDECYSELYFKEKPPSLLEAAIKAGNESFKNILVVNSISKRSSAPGLRSGFIAGDAELLKSYGLYRTYVGCALPLPMQRSATVAWSDEEHVQKFRKNYKKNFKLAEEILGLDTPEGTFYIWLEVGDALEFAKKAFCEQSLKVMPGEYLARSDEKGENPGKGYVRIALVHDEKVTKEALKRLKALL